MTEQEKAAIKAEYATIPERDDGIQKAVVWNGELHRTPSYEEIRDWVYDSVCDALDGCQVEPDGTCPHGAPSWLRAIGMI